jgi:hypothetical protein
MLVVLFGQWGTPKDFECDGGIAKKAEHQYGQRDSTEDTVRFAHDGPSPHQRDHQDAVRDTCHPQKPSRQWLRHGLQPLGGGRAFGWKKQQRVPTFDIVELAGLAKPREASHRNLESAKKADRQREGSRRIDETVWSVTGRPVPRQRSGHRAVRDTEPCEESNRAHRRIVCAHDGAAKRVAVRFCTALHTGWCALHTFRESPCKNALVVIAR